MATRKPTIDYPYGDKRLMRVTWTGLLNTDDGDPVQVGQYQSKTVQVIGTFGAAGNARIAGSLDGTTFAALNSPASAALDITAAKVLGVLENAVLIKPQITAGDGTTNLTVVLLARNDASNFG